MTDPRIADSLAAALTRRRRIGAALLLCAAALLLIGFALPWMVVTPLNDVAVSKNGPLAQSYGPLSFFARPLPEAITAMTFCFPEAPVLVALLLAVTRFAYLTQRRPPTQFDLVIAACAIGLISVGITLLLLYVGQLSFYRTFPPLYARDLTWGLWLSLLGYPAAFIGCFLVRRRRSERASVLAA